MRHLRLVFFIALLAVALGFSTQAQARVFVGVGIGPVIAPVPYAYGPPVCDYGYYDYYPYACAPYGFYGPDWFAGGIFIGAGPWFHHGWYPGVYRGGFGYRGGIAYRGGYAPRGGFVAHGAAPAGGFHGSAGFHGGGAHRGR